MKLTQHRAHDKMAPRSGILTRAVVQTDDTSGPTTDLDSDLAAAKAALAVAAAACQLSRAERQSAQARVSSLQAALGAQHDRERRQRWADPARVDALRDAEALVTTAQQELDAVVKRLRTEFAARRRSQGKSTNPGMLDIVGTELVADLRYVSAAEALQAARGLKLQAARALERSTLAREYQAGVAAREAERASRLPDRIMQGRLAGLRARLTAGPRRPTQGWPTAGSITFSDDVSS